jgi:hypothetical protein
MTHLSLDQLLEAREPGLEPGESAARAHLAACAECQAEAARLDQRTARLRALASLRPARDRWPALEQRLRDDRRGRRRRAATWIALAAAASLGMAVGVRWFHHRPTPAEQLAIDEAMARSRQLEQLIQSYNPDARVTDGRTVRVAGELEDRIALVDRQLEAAQMLDAGRRDAALLGLWRQRVGLLNALVDVHLTRASAVGF